VINDMIMRVWWQSANGHGKISWPYETQIVENLYILSSVFCRQDSHRPWEEESEDLGDMGGVDSEETWQGMGRRERRV
jgi:hypothetical protein